MTNRWARGTDVPQATWTSTRTSLWQQKNNRSNTSALCVPVRWANLLFIILPNFTPVVTNVSISFWPKVADFEDPRWGSTYGEIQRSQVLDCCLTGQTFWTWTFHLSSSHSATTCCSLFPKKKKKKFAKAALLNVTLPNKSRANYLASWERKKMPQ